ncbi:hypothetical protein ACSFCW_08460 [Yokenella regensburgei]|uniref:hypothetical protein n=1 Tax=Yokenella regensburgei TaxID=158877 RepID=UPI003ED8A2D1
MININKFSIYFIWLACVFDPIGKIFYAKYLSILLMLVIIIINIFKKKISVGLYSVALIFFSLILPVYGLVLSIVYGGLTDNFIDTSYLISGLFFFLTLGFLNGNENVAVDGLIFSLRCLCVAILSLFALIGSNYFGDVASFYITNGIAFISTREYSGYTFPYLYFIVSPMLIYLIAYQTWSVLSDRKIVSFIWLVLAVSSMFLTGTRAAMIMAVGGVIFICGWYFYGRRSLAFYPIALLLLSIVVVIAPFTSGIASSFFDIKEGSNATKFAYLDSYSVIFNNPLCFLTGQGFNAQVWSSDFAKILTDGASKVELTYLEFIRVFGVIMFIPFMLILYCVTLGTCSKVTKLQWYPAATLLYLVVSATNPYIFSMNGMLILGLACALTIRKIDTVTKIFSKSDCSVK